MAAMLGPEATRQWLQRQIPEHIRSTGYGAAFWMGERSVAAAHWLFPRVNIPYNNVTSPPGLIEAETRDPWSKSGKYALGWVYLSIIVVVLAGAVRVYNLFTDRIRTALQEEKVQTPWNPSPSTPYDADYEMRNLYTDKSTNKLFPRVAERPQQLQVQPSLSSISWLNNFIALCRYISYRPLPEIKLHKRWRPIVFPSLAVVALSACAFAFVVLYCFVPQPLYWQDIKYGSPPLAIRAGMIAIAMLPWIVATAMKANIISLITGLGHERLNVLHRWMAYIFLFLSIVHTVPFYVGSAQDPRSFATYKSYFNIGNFYIYGSGIAALAPLAFLCVHSIYFIRSWMYELFQALHLPVAIVMYVMLIWHCHNYLSSWNYLWATGAIFLLSYVVRALFYVNWLKPFRLSWLIGEECTVTIMPENAVKITIATQVKWRPGQYAYIRMPGVSIFENHPFTIASLCSDDFPSDYGEEYRDMIMVFRPFGGFTRKVMNKALMKGPFHTYRAFIDGPFGGMRRRLDAFDDVVLVAGGSGITAIVSQLLDLIKRMREGKAVTKKVTVIWALKRPETMTWFQEELRICREFAPPDSVDCQFFITAAKRQDAGGRLMNAQQPSRPVSEYFREKMNEAFQGIAEKRVSNMSTKRHSALIADVARGNPELEKRLREENEDAVPSLPKAQAASIRHAAPKSRLQLQTNFASSKHSDGDSTHGSEPYSERASSETADAEYVQQQRQKTAEYLQAPANNDIRLGGLQQQLAHQTMRQSNKSKARNLSIDVAAAIASGHGAITVDATSPAPVPYPTYPAATAQFPNYNQYQGPPTGDSTKQEPGVAAANLASSFDFGFPSTPTEFQKNIMRFAFLPAAVKKRDGWSTEYGRPQIPYMLREMSREWGRRTCVFVCGPPSMRISVSQEVARLQRRVWENEGVDEIFLHAENYAI